MNLKRNAWTTSAIAAVVAMSVASCAALPRPPGSSAAPDVSYFRFDAATPLAPATDFAPWAELMTANRASGATIDSCVADKAACTTTGLMRLRRLLELAQPLPRNEQLRLVHEYFNGVTWTPQHAGTSDADLWETLYDVATTARADCKGIAFAKYFTLRRLGWAPEDLRVVMGWDVEQSDWHALLAVRLDGVTYMLDTIQAVQRPSAFPLIRMVYSISEAGIWDHAPAYTPTYTSAHKPDASRAARLAAFTEAKEDQ